MTRRVVGVGMLAGALLATGSAVSGRAAAQAPGRAMFGNTFSRNMVSEETGLAAEWDVKSGKNVKWWADVGSQAYAGPVVLGGRVFVGTNNDAFRNPKLRQDRGVVMAFEEEDGDFLWQMTHEKLPAGRVNDWPQQGICSTPYVEGNRLYYTSNRATIVSLDTEGFRDGENDGKAEEAEKTEIDGDVVWEYDMIKELDVFPHNLAVSSPLVVDGVLYATTGNGVDEGHVNIPSPDAPSFIALDARTGELVWENNLPGKNIFHGTWSNPTYAVIKGRPQVLFPGGDGWLYSLEPKTGKLIWKFDGNPPGSKYILGGRGTANEIIGTAVVWDDKVYFGMGQDPEHGEGVGNLWAVDATLEGDVTGKGVVWHRGGDDFHRTISTVAIHDGIVYAADLSGFLYALDARTGQHHWTHDLLAAVWGSPFVADGKVYLGDEDGDVEVLRAGKTKQVLGSHTMGISVYSTPVAKDGVLYVLARNRLFALKPGATFKPATPRQMEHPTGN
ncbi:MAG TPA: PQQ-binding-like beta-propeller repeat protein [Vicinamibacteria bacterium]|nr:PQQ-binding-like beta-propeller repeat protein [Vicinamibacteria bacterium]